MNQSKEKSRKRVRIFICAALAALLLVVAVVAINTITVRSDSGALLEVGQSELEKRDFALVPGARVRDGRPSRHLQDRLDRAAELYQNGLVDSILISGWAQEPEVMKNYLVDQNIPPEDIYRDDYGLDTYNTVRRARDTFPKSTFYFCTQKQFAARSGYLMQRVGLQGNCIATQPTYVGIRVTIRECIAGSKAVWEGGIRKPPARYPAQDYPIMGGEGV